MNGRPKNKQHRLSGAGKLYAHIASLLRRNIREAIWRPGFKLPALDVLAETHGVSIVTIRHAVALLENEGLLRRVHGKGTFVTDSNGMNGWLRVNTTWDEILEFYSINSSRLRIKNLYMGVHSKHFNTLSLGHNTKNAESYMYMHRLHYINNVPYALSYVYIDENIYSVCPDRFKTELALTVMDSLFTHMVCEANQLLLITSSSGGVEEHLDIPQGMPVAEVHRSILDSSGKLVYYSTMRYRGDLIKVESRLK